MYDTRHHLKQIQEFTVQYEQKKVQISHAIKNYTNLVS